MSIKSLSLLTILCICSTTYSMQRVARAAKLTLEEINAQRAILQGVKSGALNALRRLQEQGASFNFTHPAATGGPLLLAIDRHKDPDTQKELVQFLVKETDIDINRTIPGGFDALTWAVLTAATDTASYLLDQPGIVVSQDGTDTAFVRSLQIQELALAQKILEKKPSVSKHALRAIQLLPKEHQAHFMSIIAKTSTTQNHD